MDLLRLAGQIREWGLELGFAQIGITGTRLTEAEARLEAWVARGFQGELHYMTQHGRRRSRPGDLVPGTQRVISARMDYLPAGAAPCRSSAG